MESRRDFQASAVSKIMEEFEPTLQTRSRSLRLRLERPHLVGRLFPCLHSSDLSPQSRGFPAEAQHMLKLNLRNPQPKVACTSKRRYSHLGQRVRLARRKNGLFQARGDAGVLPTELNGSRSEAHFLAKQLAAAAEEVHEERTAHLGPEGGCRT